MFELNKGVYTIKELIPKDIWDLPYNEFKKKIRKHKKIYPREKIFLLLFKKFSPTWDIAIDGLLSMEGLQLNKHQLFGLIKEINPYFGETIEAQRFYDYIKKDKLLFTSCNLSDIIHILER